MPPRATAHSAAHRARSPPYTSFHVEYASDLVAKPAAGSEARDELPRRAEVQTDGAPPSFEERLPHALPMRPPRERTRTAVVRASAVARRPHYFCRSSAAARVAPMMPMPRHEITLLLPIYFRCHVARRLSLLLQAAMPTPHTATA